MFDGWVSWYLDALPWLTPILITLALVYGVISGWLVRGDWVDAQAADELDEFFKRQGWEE